MIVELNRFIGRSQLLAIKEACRGEEGKYFRAMITDWAETIAKMPKTYETDGQGDEAPVTLHYFLGGSDWYIIEKDQEAEQIQAFGFCCLNGNKVFAELGYTSIEEIIKYGAELDLYYKPETLGEVLKRFKEAA